MIIDDNKSVTYQRKQFEKPKHSTVLFEKFLNDNNCILPDTEILDIGAGGGDVMLYLAKKSPRTKFLGIDYNKAVVSMGKKVLSGHNCPNVSLEAGDWFDLPGSYKDRFDGIFNVHALCCFKRLKAALEPLIKLDPRWIAFNSLFYNGPLEVLIHIRDLEKTELKDNDPDGDFNIFSLPATKKYLSDNGYAKFEYTRFQIPVDLPRPSDGRRGTYTIKTELEEKSQFSGPVYLPWYFVLGQKG